MGDIMPYATGPAPVYYASGFVSRADFWRLGLIFGLVSAPSRMSAAAPLATGGRGEVCRTAPHRRHDPRPGRRDRRRRRRRSLGRQAPFDLLDPAFELAETAAELENLLAKVLSVRVVLVEP